MEHSSAGQYSATVAEYQVNSLGDGNRIFPKAQINGPSLAGLQAVIGLLLVSLLALLTWNLYKGHIPLPWNCLKKREQTEERGDLNSAVTYQDAQRPAAGEKKLLVSDGDYSTNYKNPGPEGAELIDAKESDLPKVNLQSLQFIDNESEI